MKDKKDNDLAMAISLGLCFGSAIGILIGTLNDNLTLGLCYGPGIGVCIGVLINSMTNKKD